jgi:isoleucyl-tRNA synthetase
MPFFSESLYQEIKDVNMPESVHLCDWPEIGKISDEEKDILVKMSEIRNAVSTGLELRAKAGIKVRQPLASLTIKDKALEGKKEFLDLLVDEVNVKTILFDQNISEVAILDINITPELRSEGQVRDLFRAIQELRKTGGFAVGEQVALTVETSDAGWNLIIDPKNINVLAGPAYLADIKRGILEDIEPQKIGDLEFKLALFKI